MGNLRLQIKNTIKFCDLVRLRHDNVSEEVQVAQIPHVFPRSIARLPVKVYRHVAYIVGTSRWLR